MDHLGSVLADCWSLGDQRFGLAPALDHLVSAGQHSDRGDAFPRAVLYVDGHEPGDEERSSDRGARNRSETGENTSSQSRTVASRLGKRAARLALPGSN